MINTRISNLDVLRFLCALMVVLYHFILDGPRNNLSLPITQNETILYVANFGALGVQFFFVISGFCIILSLKPGMGGFDFILKRFIRLYPAYWLTILFIGLVYGLFLVTTKLGVYGTNNDFQSTQGLLAYLLPLKGILINFTMLQSFFDTPNLAGVFWTLGCELRFYLFITAILFFRQTNNIIFYMYLWLFLSAIYNFFPSFNYLNYNNFLMPLYTGYFITGVVIGIVYNKKFNFLLVTLLLLSQFLNVFQLYQDYGVINKFCPIICFYFSGLTIFMRAIYNNKFKTSLCKSNHKLAAILGGLSYTLYLCHGNSGIIFINALSAIVLNRWVILTMVTLFMLFISWVIYVLEKYLQAFFYRIKDYLISNPLIKPARA